jgi:hypothetical protein
MPKITPVTFSPLAITMSVERDAKRSPHIHLSSIIKDRLITAGIGRQVKGRPLTREEQHLIFERGFLWERMVKEFCDTEHWLQSQIEESAHKHLTQGIYESPSHLVRPGECMLDGIYMTPDAIDMKGYHVEEWKATAMRYKGFNIEDRRIEWLWQAGSYAHVFGMNKAIIRIWHVSDNIINSQLVEWTDDEIKENWRQIREHYDYMCERSKLTGRG